ncbi:uncharacterized protein LOC121714280 [Alosa sapidissima]|uniref:uncharacterized protein LOC121714280 n=1 Tax=Alosa sapidissima TaxID=34773 RepID=UPI001C097077|nr:uncharacterized protein LOC121714280 [Alosa sapidissima]
MSDIDVNDDGTLTHLTFDSLSRERYLAKIALIGGVDPYTTPVDGMVALTAAVRYPNVEYHDVYHYLVNTPSPYTGADLKAYKSLDAFNFVINGWVRNILVQETADDIFATTASVFHSQYLNKEPLKAWLAAKTDGTIITAHCTCKAGLSEACSHTAAVAFALYVYAKSKQDVGVTQLPCSWLGNSSTKESPAQYATLAVIDFTRPAKRLTSVLHVQQGPTRQAPFQRNPILAPSQIEKAEFYRSLHSSNPTAALLSILPTYCEAFIPKSHSIPKPLSSLYNAENLQKDYNQLLEESNKILCGDLLNITEEQVNIIIDSTRDQYKSKVWFGQRCGRVTASVCKAVVKSDVYNPPKSLIKSICYLGNTNFSTKETRQDVFSILWKLIY